MTQPRNRPGSRGRPARRGGPIVRRRPNLPPVEPLHPTADPPQIESFTEFELDPDVQQVIADMNIVKPTPIQALGIGPALEGRDLIAKAETGTGKTLVFGAPMMSKIDPNRASVLGLVLCPTRELAQQVAAVLEALGEPRGLSVVLIVGGDPAGPQVAALQAGAQVVVGTPGRVIDLYEQGFLSFPWTEFVVLDEADEMLEIGFLDDVKKILKFTPDERQTMLFSATFPDDLLRLAREHTRNPAEMATASGIKTVDKIRQEFISLDESDRPLALIRLLEQSEPTDIFLVFCERRTEVEQLMRRLERMALPIKALHGGYDQAARFRVMSAFRTGEVKALIATDVASRGLDVQLVTHVVNFSVPRSVTDYTHRIGRTGRAGREGHAITLVSHDHARRWKQLLRDAPWDVERVEPPTARGGYERNRPRRRSTSAMRPGDREERGQGRDSDSRRREGRDRDRDRGQGRDRGGDRERESRRERRPERESGRERPPAPQPERHDAPVRLPEGRQRRQRDASDPPPRVNLPASEPRRAADSGDSREEERRPRRERSRRPARAEKPSRSDQETPREQRPRSEGRSRSNKRPHSRDEGRPRPSSGSRENEADQPSPPPRTRRREETDESGSGFGSGL